VHTFSATSPLWFAGLLPHLALGSGAGWWDRDQGRPGQGAVLGLPVAGAPSGCQKPPLTPLPAGSPFRVPPLLAVTGSPEVPAAGKDPLPLHQLGLEPESAILLRQPRHVPVESFIHHFRDAH